MDNMQYNQNYNSNYNQNPNQGYNPNYNQDPNQGYTPNYNPNYNPNYMPPQQPQRPMKWHKFLIYFSLWAGALLCLSNAVQLVTGMHYGGAYERGMVYSYMPSLRAVDIVFALMHVAAGVFYIYVRFQLAGLRRGAPGKLLACLIVPTAISVVYSLVITAMMGIELVFSELIRTIVGAVVIVVINKIYYGKRSHMFVN